MSYQLGRNIRHQHPLKTEIYKKGYTISNFASLSGLSRFTLNNIFKGSMPRGDTTCLISKQLDLTYERVVELCQH